MVDYERYWKVRRRKDEVTSVPSEILKFITRLQSSTMHTCLREAESHLMQLYTREQINNYGEAVNFDVPANALCYICHYSLTHVLDCFKALSITALEKVKYREWFVRKANAQLSICAIGGGPGTDAAILQAHIQWLSSASQPVFESKLPTIADVCIFDRRTNWIESYNNIFRPSFELPDANYVSFDFTSDEMFREEHLNQLRQADIVSVIKFITAVIKKDSPNSQRRRVVQMLQTVAKNMKSDSLLLYADTGHSYFGNLVNEVLSKSPSFVELFREVFEFTNLPNLWFNGAKVPTNYVLEVQVWHKVQ